MTKVYKANSVAHIVVIVNGKSRRVSFAAKTGGGSTFRTDDEALQKAIESHYRFGELFHLAETFEDKKPKKAAKPVDKPAENPETTNIVQDNGEQKPEDGNTTDQAPSDVEDEQAQTVQDNGEQKPEDGNTTDQAPSDVEDEQAQTVQDNGETEDDDIQEVEGEQSNLTKVKVTDFEDARDYLSDKFGISRTKIRSQKAVKEAAEANGIVFVGL